MRLIYIISTIILFSTCNIFSINIYVNPTSGSDVSGTGTIINPYKTIGKACQFAYGGDTIYVRGGVPNGTPHINVQDVIRRRNPDSGWVYIRPYQNEIVILDGNNSSIPDWEGIIRIESSKRISLKGFTIRKNNNQATGYGGLGIFINSYDSLSKFINIDSCIIYEIKKHGILVQGCNVTINNCEIYNTVLRNQFGSACVWEQALSSYVDMNQPGHPNLNTQITFSNNKIHHSWGEGIGMIRTDSFTVNNNQVFNCYSVNIYCDNSYNGKIYNNWIYSDDTLYNRRCWNPPSDYSAPANGIFWAAEGNNYVNNRPVENLVIYNNLIFGTSPAFGWFRDDSNNYYNNSYRNIKIIYNTVFNVNSYNTFYLEPDTLNILPPTNCEFKNNIIPKGRYRGTTYEYFTGNMHYYQTDKWVFANNCFIDAPIPPLLPSGNNVQFDPSFINSNINNPNSFKLSINSPLKDIGIIIPAVILDYWYAGRDNSPSIGFHEYGGVAAISHNGNGIPKCFRLNQNYPNPFNPVTNIKFDIVKKGIVKLTIYDALGRIICELVNQELSSGSYKIDWNASAYPGGVYFCRLQANGFSETKKMVLVK